jgi:hypothetical protein
MLAFVNLNDCSDCTLSNLQLEPKTSEPFGAKRSIPPILRDEPFQRIVLKEHRITNADSHV